MRRARAAFVGLGGVVLLCPLLSWLCEAGGGLAAAAAPAGGGVSGTPSNVRADQVSVDSRGATLLATGHVSVTYGALRVTSDSLRLNRSDGTAVFQGHVAVTDPAGRALGDTITLFATRDGQVVRALLAGHASVETPSYAVIADRIDADRARDRITADAHVTLFSQPDVIVTGTRATYDQRSGDAVILGSASAPATVQNRDGRIAGARVDFSRNSMRAVIRGPVTADLFDAKLTGAGATIDLRRGIAVFAGGAVLSRRQGILEADEITVFYRDRRFIAEGRTHMTYRDSEGSPSP